MSNGTIAIKRWEGFKQMTGEGSWQFLYERAEKGKDEVAYAISTTQYSFRAKVKADGKEDQEMRRFLEEKHAVETDGWVDFDQLFKGTI